MTDYQSIWGGTKNRWLGIEYRGNEILSAFVVGAWTGMILFFIFVLLTLITQANAAIIAMLFFLGLWLGCGIAAIRILRRRRKFLKVQP
jgi:hypothetical protein